MKLLLLISAFLFNSSFLKATNNDSIDVVYKNAFIELQKMLSNVEPLNFKKAVFITENAYFNNALSYKDYNSYIQFLVSLSKAYRKANPLKKYFFADSNDVNISSSVFKILKDSLYDSKKQLIMPPYTYDFEDSFGEKDWSKIFVVKLMETHTGNCHSLPFLYKILCEEQGVNAYLAYAPNHIYIKQRCKKDGWYNTELTSGVFPIDAWIIASGYVSTEAIKNSLYMDTLSQKQSISQCLVDLARGYQRLRKENYEPFVLECLNEAIKYSPNYVEGLIYKGETLKSIYEKTDSTQTEKKQELFNEMQKTFVRLVKLGYREIPEKNYKEWINSLTKNKESFQNKQINRTFNKSK